MSILGSRLKEVRGKQTQTEVADKIGISRARYSHYENGRSEPDYETLEKIANFFDVSVDWLMGRSDNPNYLDKADRSQVPEPNAENNVDFDAMQEINRLLKEYGIEQSGFFDIESWKAMGPEDIEKLESYFKFITEEAKRREKDQQD